MTSRKGRWAWSPEQEDWLRAQGPTLEVDELTAQFNSRFGAGITPRSMGAKAWRLGVGYKARQAAVLEMEGRRHWRYNAAHKRWLAQNATQGEWEDIDRRFRETFGASPGVIALRGKAVKLGVRRVKTERRESDEQVRWLKMHAPTASREGIAQRFAERFATAPSQNRVDDIRKRHNIKVGRRCYPFGTEEDHWLEGNAPKQPYDALTRRFNERFKAKVDEEAIRRRCRKLAVRAPRNGRHPEYTENELTWLRTEGATMDIETLYERFVEEFGTERSKSGLALACAKRGIRPRRGTGRYPWSASEKSWLLANAPKHTVETLTDALNTVFGTRLCSETIRRHCKSMGAEVRSEHRKYSEDEEQWLLEHGPSNDPKTSQEAFNARFEADVAKKALVGKMKALGIQPLMTPPRQAVDIEELARNLLEESVRDPETGCLLNRRETEENGVPTTLRYSTRVRCRDIVARVRLDDCRGAAQRREALPNEKCSGHPRCIEPEHLQWKPRVCDAIGCGEFAGKADLCDVHHTMRERGEPLAPIEGARTERQPIGMTWEETVVWALKRGIRDEETGCLRWPRTQENGYAVAQFKNESRKVGRHVLRWFKGEPPKDKPIMCHSMACGRNKDCIEPSHLRWGDCRENMRDVAMSGQAKHLKLTVDQVREIKRRLATGKETVKQISLDYPVRTEQIYTIQKGRAWGWLDPRDEAAARSRSRRAKAG